MVVVVLPKGFTRIFCWSKNAWVLSGKDKGKQETQRHMPSRQTMWVIIEKFCSFLRNISRQKAVFMLAKQRGEA